MAEIEISTFIVSLLAGLIPAGLWLWFWLREDSKNPEPPRLLLAAFIAGALAVLPALFLERFAHSFLYEGTALIIVWAAIEELLKYGAAYFVAFRKFCLGKSVCLDEPIDPLIYMVTVALGFAAIENALFLLTPLGTGNTEAALLTGNLRFIGAMVLHVIAGACIGVAMGLSFFKSKKMKHVYVWMGIFTAVSLHALFNISIIKSEGENLFFVFGALWGIAIIVLYFAEKIKKMYAVPR